MGSGTGDRPAGEVLVPEHAPASLRFPSAFAFVGSGCLLVLEIVAGRLVAPEVGASLYTWTSVIGVVLGGISLGNYLGGRIADRRPSRSTLALLYLAGSGASLAVLAVVGHAASLELPQSAPAFLQVLWLTAVLFFVPATVLGTPVPLLTKLALTSVAETGRVVGRIQAAAALGSIAGTFLTGFLLISWIGTRHIVAGIAGTMLVLAVLARPPWLLGRAFELGSLAVVIVVAGWASHSPCTRESAYYCIRVEDGVDNGQRVRYLNLDRLLDSVVALDDPAKPLYDYEQVYASVAQATHPLGSSIDSLVIGGGGYTLPRYLEKNYRGITTVAEIDPEVTAVARRYLRYRDTPRVKIVHGDARRTLTRMASGQKFDFVFADAFNDYAIPYHLTTREFHKLVARHLEPHGLYVLNLIDGVDHDLLRSEVRTLKETFPHVAVLAPPGTLGSPTRWTFVVVAGNDSRIDSLPTAVPRSQLDAFVDGGHSVLLTDDHVPVDQLLAPVFSQLLNGKG